METQPLDPLSSLIAANQQNAIEVNGPKQLGQSDFLQLLVAKLENQDPLAPSEDSEFVAQLATFSSLEQLVNANDNLQTLALGQSQIVNAQALSLIGKEALVESDSQVRIHNGRPDTIVYSVPKPATSVTLTVTNEAGEVVRTFELDNTAKGRVTLEWDGTDADGNPLADGIYHLEVQAQDLEGLPMEISLFKSLPIDGVNFAGGFITLISGDLEIPIDSIYEFRASQNLP